VLKFASYNELNELLMSYSRANRVEPSFKSKLGMSTSQADLTRCFNELERVEPSFLGWNCSPSDSSLRFERKCVRVCVDGVGQIQLLIIGSLALL
jgi:hypothetical protein